MPPIDFEVLAETAFKAIKGGLSTPVTYQPKQGGSFPIRGIFDDRVQEIDPDTQIPVSGNVYSLGVQLSDIPFPPEKGDVVIIKTISYKVIEAQEDGVEGVSSFLILHKVN